MCCNIKSFKKDCQNRFTNHANDVKLILKCLSGNIWVVPPVICKSLVNVICINIFSGCPVSFLWFSAVVWVCAAGYLWINHGHVCNVLNFICCKAIAEKFIRQIWQAGSLTMCSFTGITCNILKNVAFPE